MEATTQAAPAGDNAAVATAAAAAPAAVTTPAAAAPAGEKAAAAPGTDLNGSGQNGKTSITATLTDDNRELWTKKGWGDDINAAVKSYKDLQTEFSARKSLVVPADDADKETQDAFYKQVGRPDSPDGYTFGVPEGVPADMPYDQNFAAAFKNWSHQAGLNPKQAASIHNEYVRSALAAQTAQAEAINGKITSTHGELTKDWGQPESEGYKKNVEMARRAMTQLDLTQSFKDAGFIDPRSGMVTDAKVAKALARIGAAQFGEDAMFAGPSGVIDNPFSDKTFNMTKQSLLIKNDPARAAILIRASGQKPEDFGMAAPR